MRHTPARILPAALLGAAGFALGGSAAERTPYGMDAVPGAMFYTEPWVRYGSDPVPAGRTSDFGFRDDYGLDGIPEAAIPEIHIHIRQVFPHHLLEVLTGARDERPSPVKPGR
jgi:hypothetical protein